MDHITRISNAIQRASVSSPSIFKPALLSDLVQAYGGLDPNLLSSVVEMWEKVADLSDVGKVDEAIVLILNPEFQKLLTAH